MADTAHMHHVCMQPQLDSTTKRHAWLAQQSNRASSQHQQTLHLAAVQLCNFASGTQRTAKDGGGSRLEEEPDDGRRQWSHTSAVKQSVNIIIFTNKQKYWGQPNKKGPDIKGCEKSIMSFISRILCQFQIGTTGDGCCQAGAVVRSFSKSL